VIAGRGIDSLSVSSCTFVLTQKSITAAIVLPMSPGIFRSTKDVLASQLLEQARQVSGDEQLETNLKNVTLSSVRRLAGLRPPSAHRAPR